MKRAEFDVFSAAFVGSFNVIQWGGASVWKVGGASGKLFAIHSNWGQASGIVLKPTEMAREIWRGQKGVALAPYLGRSGWIKIDEGAMEEAVLCDMIRASYDLNAAKLTRAQRLKFGIQIQEGQI